MKKKETIKAQNNFDSLSEKCRSEIEKRKSGAFVINLFMFDFIVKGWIQYCPVLIDNTLEIDLIGVFSPRKLMSYFGIISSKPLVVFQFISKEKVSPLKKEQTYKIENKQEFFLLNSENFDKFHKTCGLKLLEPPKVIVSTTL